MRWLEKVPDAPEYLGDVAKQKWREVSTALLNSRGLREQDLAIVEVASVAYENWRKAMQGVEEYGVAILVMDKIGNHKTASNQYLTEARYWQDVMVKRLVDLGLARDGMTRELDDTTEEKGEGGSRKAEKEKKKGLSGLKVVG